MTITSPTSDKPTLFPTRWGRWLQAGRMQFLTLLAVAGVGSLVFATGLAPLLAANDAKAEPVMGKINHEALAKLIDQQITAKLAENKIPASEQCSDAEFIRRVTLDITGVIPTAERVGTFLKSSDPNKRAKLIDELLEDSRYGKFFGEVWSDVLVPKISNNRRLNNKPLQDWLTEKLNSNTAWDKLAYELITASGAQDKNGAVTFFIGNFGPDQVTNKVSQHFLGVQLQCAQCHNHPFTDWKQDEYWGVASFFQKVGLNVNPNQAAKQGIQPTIREYTQQELRGSPRGVKGKKGKAKAKAKNRIRVRLFRIPNDGKKLPPSYLLDKSNPSLNQAEPYRPALAKWITSKENRFFARAISNKLWAHFFGRGLVNPVDDMHDDNPSTHPELLKQVAQQVKANDFDLKYLIRAICNSESYQRSSRPTGDNKDDNEYYGRAYVRQLSPAQLYDSLALVLKNDNPVQNNNRRRKVPANRRNGNGPRDQFIGFFSGDDGYKPMEYQAGIPQALRLMNSRQLGLTNGLIGRATKAGSKTSQVIEHIYLSTVSRRPTEAETQRLTEYVQKQSNARTAYTDIAWALVNSSEFALNH